LLASPTRDVETDARLVGAFKSEERYGGQTQTEKQNEKEPIREKAKEQKHPAVPDQ
jgi:hypothetical protein